MTYSIHRTINGNTTEFYSGFDTFEQVNSILIGLTDLYRKNKNKVLMDKWQLRVNDNEIIYQVIP